MTAHLPECEARVARLHAADAALWGDCGRDAADFNDMQDAVVMGEVLDYATRMPPLAVAAHRGRLGVG
jgi:hypothetical protein